MSTLLVDIHLAFQKLESLQAELTSQIHQASGPAWFPDQLVPSGQFGNNHRKALETITATHNRDDFIPAPTGILYLPPGAGGLVQEINALKNAIRSLITQLRKAEGMSGNRLDHIIEKLDKSRDKQVGKALKALGLARINLLWLYRNIRLLPPGAQSVSYSWTFKERTVEEVTFEDVLLRANNLLDEKGIAYTQDTLAKLPPGTPLYVCKTMKPHLKVNAVYLDNNNAKTRLTFRAPTPFLMQDAPLPPIRYPKTNKDTGRGDRSDKRISDIPIIKGMNVYTLKDESYG